jgi:3-phosphoshikimate 1-carboxyvinyltransferase
VIFEALPAAGPLSGTVRVPGDKSISHRAVLFAAMSEGSSRLIGVLDSEDVRSTIQAVRALGAVVEVVRETPVGLDMFVTGWGQHGPVAQDEPIDCGNSGTTCRLLLGVLAGWPISVTLDGDASLRRRPMRRVTEPLSAMGADFETTDGHLPIHLLGGPLRGIRFESRVASAQVKTSVLLAGLRAKGATIVVEPAASRDHTERLLPAFGIGVERNVRERSATVAGFARLSASDVVVPADPSSAAFLAGAATLVDGSSVTLPDVALNPTRTGFVRVLERMGADIAVELDRATGAEPVGTVRARFRAGLRPTVVRADEVPSLVDEVPLLAVVATAADGTTRFEGIAELRVKESDRLQAIVDGLTALGAVARAGDDWLEIDGPARLRGATLSSLGDHRLAMAWAVAALVANGPVSIEDWEAVAVSYPRFAADLSALLTTR